MRSARFFIVFSSVPDIVNKGHYSIRLDESLHVNKPRDSRLSLSKLLDKISFRIILNALFPTQANCYLYPDIIFRPTISSTFLCCEPWNSHVRCISMTATYKVHICDEMPAFSCIAKPVAGFKFQVMLNDISFISHCLIIIHDYKGFEWRNE
jgi:hypothetical protein